jgi:hypothetical protein
MTFRRIAFTALVLATVITSAAHAEPSRRDILRLASPVTEETLQRIEKQRGAAFRDDELKEAIGSDAFLQEYPKALADFCVTHPEVAACERPGK